MDYLQLWNFILWAGGTFRSFTFLELSYLEWIGLLWTLAWIVYCIPYFINTLYCIWIAPVLGHYANLRKMGKWAGEEDDDKSLVVAVIVVTGASDGIGKAYAEEIARLGVNVVLISRSKSKLDDLARELGDKFGVQTKVVSVDFTEGLHIYDEIQKELEGLEIGTLVNNIGIFYPYVEYFTERPNARKHSQDMIFCNVFPVTFMTHMILPQMCSRGRGVIINIGSYLGTIPCPLNSMYSGTKAFTERFTESLSMEYEKSGVIIQAVIPEYVSTRMSGVTKPSWTTPSAKEYVQKALKTVGVESRTSVYIPHRLAILAHETGIFLWRRFGSRAIFNVFLHLRANSKHRLAVLKQSQRT